MADKASPLSAVFGSASGGDKSLSEAEPDAAAIPEDFEDYALTAFPELEGDQARLEALYNAMKACAG